MFLWEKITINQFHAKTKEMVIEYEKVGGVDTQRPHTTHLEFVL